MSAIKESKNSTNGIFQILLDRIKNDLDVMVENNIDTEVMRYVFTWDNAIFLAPNIKAFIYGTKKISFRCRLRMKLSMIYNDYNITMHTVNDKMNDQLLSISLKKKREETDNFWIEKHH